MMFNLFKKPDFESKDPNDLTLTKLSKPWIGDRRYCSICKKSTGHYEYMSGICNSCGSFESQVIYGRSYRKIKINGKWKVQYKYRNGDTEVVDKEY